jgi:hypothetical protein
MDHFTSLLVVLQFQFVDEQGGWWLGHMVIQLSHDVVWQLEVGETFLSDQRDCFAIDWKLSPLIGKKNTKGIDVIHLFGIKVASLFCKLSHGLDYL